MACAVSERAIQLYDRDPYVFFGLGDQYLGFHMYRPALTYFSKVLEIDSTFVEARARLAMALTMLGRYNEAEVQARRALHEETRSGSTMRWCLAVIAKYRPTGRPPVELPPPVSPTDTASSASGKLPPPLQNALPDSAQARLQNSKSK